MSIRKPKYLPVRNKWIAKCLAPEKLLKPKFEHMSQQDRLLRACMLAYMKLHPMCRLEEMTEAQVSDTLHCEICNTIGDDAFCAWLDTWKD